MRHIAHISFARLVLTLLIAATPWAAARADAPIYNVERQVVARADGKPATAEQVKLAIIRSGSMRGWVITPDGEGKLVGNILVRGRHSATIDITYDGGGFSIKYRASDNLRYEKSDDGKETIHNNYNRWVNNLRHDTVNAIMSIVE